MPLLITLLILVPIIELAVIIQIGSMIGLWWTIALLIGDSLLGAWLLMREGSRSWLRFRQAISDGKIPAQETADGGLIISGGALLLTPGFLTDFVGLLLLFKPTRDRIRCWALPRLIKAAATSATGPSLGWTLRGAIWGSRAAKNNNKHRSADAYDIDGTATEIDLMLPELSDLKADQKINLNKSN